MTLEAQGSPIDLDSPGQTRLVSTSEVEARLRIDESRGLLPVLVPAPTSADRGRLALCIEDAIEAALIRRGACPPGIGAGSDLDGSLGDQLYRARLVEHRGIALGLPALDGIATFAGTLDAEDSAVLRWWFRATHERPLFVYVDERNRYLGVYGRPSPLYEVMTRIALPESRPSEPAPLVAPDVAASMSAAETTLPEFEGDASSSDDTTDDTTDDSTDEAVPDSEPTSESDSEPMYLPDLASTRPSSPPSNPQPEPVSDLVGAVIAELADRNHERTTEFAEVATSEPAPVPHVTDGERDEAHRAIANQPQGPLNALAAELWPTWVRDLEGASGPKPLGAVERMFVSSYVPLNDAVARGIAPASARPALEAWATSFAQSYKEAFTALCVRSKRPTMVLDVPDLALRLARLHGARSVQLVLVDGLRFDLGLRVEQRLRAELGREVALTERLLLWSALPATTSVQLELIGRGPEALKNWTGVVESEVPVARGRNAATPRRVKTGHRELLKLDLVESRFSEAGGTEAERIDAVAEETAEAIGEFLRRLPARTLAVVFGDHGFALETLESGTAPAHHGGARPEEVLVPALAYLVGGVH